MKAIIVVGDVNATSRWYPSIERTLERHAISDVARNPTVVIREHVLGIGAMVGEIAQFRKYLSDAPFPRANGNGLIAPLRAIDGMLEIGLAYRLAGCPLELIAFHDNIERDGIARLFVNRALDRDIEAFIHEGPRYKARRVTDRIKSVEELAKERQLELGIDQLAFA